MVALRQADFEMTIDYSGRQKTGLQSRLVNAVRKFLGRSQQHPLLERALARVKEKEDRKIKHRASPNEARQR
jgi:hypothetical protein